MSVQYTGQCAIQWGMFSTLWDIMSTVRGYHEYIGVCSLHLGGFYEYTRGYYDKYGEGHWKTIEFVWKPQFIEYPLVYS